ncbi:DUF3164 family protein [Flavobacterium sp.]|uniref:DUF3164 family protein n=1 Tax=Flavobacterium sp. TaxID=239 RepID=UPI0037529B25
MKPKKDQDRDSYKALVAETVPKAIFKLCRASEIISDAKTETFKFFEDILDLKNQVYGLKEKQMSHTFSTDKEEITIGYRINDGWDDTVTAGIEKVQTFISSLSTTPETAALVKVVFSLLKKDAKGNLKGSRVLELQQLTKDFNNEEFTDGVQIIAAAYKPVRSSWFIDASLINDDGTKTSIPLSMSSVDFLSGYKFEFFSEVIPEADATE